MDCFQRLIQRICLLNHACFSEIADMWEQRIGEDVLSLVCMRIRVGRTLQHREFQRAALGVVAILAVVQQADAIAVFRYIHPLMTVRLKPCLIPTCILMRRPHNMTELNVERRIVCVNCQRERRFQDLVLLVPVDLRFKINARAAGIEPDFLRDGRVHISLDDLHTGAGTVKDRGDLCRCVQYPHFLLVIIGHLPRIVLAGIILKDLQLIAERAIAEHLPLCAPVEQRFDPATAAQAHFIVAVFQCIPADLDAISRIGPHIGNHFPAERRNFIRQFHCFAIQAHHGLSCKAERVIHQYTAVCCDFGCKHMKLVLNRVFAERPNFCVIPICPFVHLKNRGAGENVVELIVQHFFPRAIDAVCVVASAMQEICIGQGFCLLQHQFGFSVVSFVFGNGGIGSAMEFQIQLTDPFRRALCPFAACVKELLSLLQMRRHKAHFRDRQTGQTFFQSTKLLQHLLGRTAAAIAIAKCDHDPVAVFFLLEAVPCAFQHGAVDVADIQCIVGGFRPLVILRRQECRKNLGSINTLP